MAILFYSTKGQYGALSNFYKSPVELDGYKFLTSEHAYQAYKFTPGSERFMEILRAPSAKEAARLGRLNDVPVREDWNDVKVSTMERVVRAKFTQNLELAELLLSTDLEELIENSPKDDFWGKVDGEGRNELGKVLMKVREDLRVSAGLHTRSLKPGSTFESFLKEAGILEEVDALAQKKIQEHKDPETALLELAVKIIN